MAAAREDEVGLAQVLAGCLVVVLFFGVIGFLSHLMWLQITSGDTEYTVTITGVDGLDAAVLEQEQAALGPAFGVAVRIDSTRYKLGKVCLGMHPSAVVSYSDAVLGTGTVPEFCAQALGVGEATATAWAMDARVPRFLRNRLAGEIRRGEAVLDVAVRTAGGGSCYGDVNRCRDRVLVCKAKIGGGPSPPCLITEVDPWSTTSDSFDPVRFVRGRAKRPPFKQRAASL